MLSNWHEAKIQSLLEENKQLRARLEETRRQCASLKSTNANLELRLKSASSDDGSTSSSSGRGASSSGATSEYFVHSNASDPNPGTGSLKRFRYHDQATSPFRTGHAISSSANPVLYTSQSRHIKPSSAPQLTTSLPSQEVFSSIETGHGDLLDHAYIPASDQLVRISSSQWQYNEALRHGSDHAASSARSTSHDRCTPSLQTRTAPMMTYPGWMIDHNRPQPGRSLR